MNLREFRAKMRAGEFKKKLCGCGCGEELEPRFDGGEHHTMGGVEVNSDCYFEKLGEVVEAHPIHQHPSQSSCSKRRLVLRRLHVCQRGHFLILWCSMRIQLSWQSTRLILVRSQVRSLVCAQIWGNIELCYNIPMPKSRVILVLGVLIALLPVLGFPSSWESFFQVVAGLSIVLLSVWSTIDKKLTQKHKAQVRSQARRVVDAPAGVPLENAKRVTDFYPKTAPPGRRASDFQKTPIIINPEDKEETEF